MPFALTTIYLLQLRSQPAMNCILIFSFRSRFLAYLTVFYFQNLGLCPALTQHSTVLASEYLWRPKPEAGEEFFGCPDIPTEMSCGANFSIKLSDGRYSNRPQPIEGRIRVPGSKIADCWTPPTWRSPHNNSPRPPRIRISGRKTVMEAVTAVVNDNHRRAASLAALPPMSPSQMPTRAPAGNLFFPVSPDRAYSEVATDLTQSGLRTLAAAAVVVEDQSGLLKPVTDQKMEEDSVILDVTVDVAEDLDLTCLASPPPARISAHGSEYDTDGPPDLADDSGCDSGCDSDEVFEHEETDDSRHQGDVPLPTAEPHHEDAGDILQAAIDAMEDDEPVAEEDPDSAEDDDKEMEEADRLLAASPTPRSPSPYCP